jgi:hypothetical protein
VLASQEILVYAQNALTVAYAAAIAAHRPAVELKKSKLVSMPLEHPKTPLMN